MNPIWSFILGGVGILGLFLTGNKRKIGFAIGFYVQFIWLAYAIITKQWGFIATALAYGFVYARNWLRWRREELALLEESK